MKHKLLLLSITFVIGIGCLLGLFDIANNHSLAALPESFIDQNNTQPVGLSSDQHDASQKPVNVSAAQPIYITATMLLERLNNGQESELLPNQTYVVFEQFYILPEVGQFYLWLNNRNDVSGDHIAEEQRLESQDGLVWTNRTATNLRDDTYDYHYLNGIRQVIKSGNMYEGWEGYYYNTVSGMWVRGIRYITSTSGITWTIVNQTALIDGAGVNVLKEGATYSMWENPHGDAGYTGSRSVRYRTSNAPDTGWGDWLTDGELVHVDGNEVEWFTRVKKLPDGTYQLFYTHHPTHHKISLASSVNGITFTNKITNLLDYGAILPDFATLLDFAVVGMSGEDWIYLTYRDLFGQGHIFVSRPERALTGLSADNDSPTVEGYPTLLTTTISTGTNVVYAWDFGDGTTGSGALAVHTYPASGTYTAVVTASNVINTLTATTTILVEETIAGLTAINDSPTLIGQTTHLSATHLTGTNVNYTWNFGDGLSGAGSEIAHVYPAVGVYTAVVTASNANNSLAATTIVTVAPSTVFLPVVTHDVCSDTASPVDIILALDTSGSMDQPSGDGNQTKLDAAKEAASTFIDLLDFPNDQAGIISFDDAATLDHPLSIDDVSLQNALQTLVPGGKTRIDLALVASREELTSSRHNPDNSPALILLTDGEPSGTTEEAVLAEADVAKAAGIIIYTIGLGESVNTDLMQAIASSLAHYYYAPSTAELTAIYEQIANAVHCP